MNILSYLLLLVNMKKVYFYYTFFYFFFLNSTIAPLKSPIHVSIRITFVLLHFLHPFSSFGSSGLFSASLLSSHIFYILLAFHTLLLPIHALMLPLHSFHILYNVFLLHNLLLPIYVVLFFFPHIYYILHHIHYHTHVDTLLFYLYFF